MPEKEKNSVVETAEEMEKRNQTASMLAEEFDSGVADTSTPLNARKKRAAEVPKKKEEAKKKQRVDLALKAQEQARVRKVAALKKLQDEARSAAWQIESLQKELGGGGIIIPEVISEPVLPPPPMPEGDQYGDFVAKPEAGPAGPVVTVQDDGEAQEEEGTSQAATINRLAGVVVDLARDLQAVKEQAVKDDGEVVLEGAGASLEPGEVVEPEGGVLNLDFTKKGRNNYLARSWTTWTEEDLDEDRQKIVQASEHARQRGTAEQRHMAGAMLDVHAQMMAVVRAANTLNSNTAGGTRDNRQQLYEFLRKINTVVEGKKF